jgi:ATP adenylyltransferase
MDRLWSPWRLAYLAGETPSRECVFCEAAVVGSDPVPDTASDDLVLVRGRDSFVILNLYPYNNGHLLVVPNRHIASLASANDNELVEVMRFTRHAELALGEAYNPDGINVGINLGRSAGAGIVGHLHVHVVPRWTGDTNFMSAIGETRVLPETLAQTAARLRPVFERLLGEQRLKPEA